SHLHNAVERAAARIDEWKRTRASYRHIQAHMGLADGLKGPLEVLQTQLVGNVSRARRSLKEYGTTQEGLYVYFGFKTPWQSGAYAFYFDEEELQRLETINPPPAA